jgi:hypothetical protein
MECESSFNELFPMRNALGTWMMFDSIRFDSIEWKIEVGNLSLSNERLESILFLFDHFEGNCLENHIKLQSIYFNVIVPLLHQSNKEDLKEST